MIYLFPAVAACLYALGSMGLKKSMQHGTSPRRVIAVSNILMACWAFPLIFFFEGSWDVMAWFAAIGAGVALFFGRICAIKALEVGDLSVVAPMLGMKTVMVAVLSMVFFPLEVTGILLVSAVLASAGIALLQRGPIERKAGTRRSALWALAASLLFAVTDISVQGSARVLGVGYFLPTLFLTVALLVPLLGQHDPPPAKGKVPMWAGSIVIGFQTTLMVLVIGLVGQATLVNVIYSTRSLWSVIVDRLLGEAHIRDYLFSRMTGALMITGAVILAILSKLT